MDHSVVVFPIFAQGEFTAAIALVVILAFVAGVIGYHYWDTWKPRTDEPVPKKPRWFYRQGQWHNRIAPTDQESETGEHEP